MKTSRPVFLASVSDPAQVTAAPAPRRANRAGRPLRFGMVCSARRERGFTLVEVVVAVALITLTFAGVIYGYVRTADRAEWSSYSLAAQSLAMQGVEQARAAKWDSQAWPVVDELPVGELGVTNFMQVQELDVPVVGEPVLATNYISVTTVSVNPPLRELRADCVWALKSRPAGITGPFTNTAVTLRTADQ